MDNFSLSWKEIKLVPDKLLGFQKITTNMVLDFKLGENFLRKPLLVADGSKNKTPSSTSYISVLSRDSVWICLLVGARKDLNVQSGEI